MRKRVLSLFMVLALCLSLLPIPALANEASDSAESVTRVTDEPERGVLGNTTLDESVPIIAVETEESVHMPPVGVKETSQLADLWDMESGDTYESATLYPSRDIIRIQNDTLADLLDGYICFWAYGNAENIDTDIFAAISDEVFANTVNKNSELNAQGLTVSAVRYVLLDKSEVNHTVTVKVIEEIDGITEESIHLLEIQANAGGGCFIKNDLYVRDEATLLADYSTEYPNTHSNTGNQAYDITQIALTQVGYREWGTNHTKYGAAYGLQDEWCAMFIWWCARQAGVSESVIKKTAYAGSVTSFCSNYQRYSSGTSVDVGNIVYFDNNNNGSPDHVGLVYKVDSGTIYTVEGNKSNCVKQCSYSRSTGTSSDGRIYAIAYPNYTGGAIVGKPTLNVRVDNTKVIFSWGTVSNADKYDIEIYQGSDFSSTNCYKKIWSQTGTSCSVELPSGSYWAKIAAVNSQSGGWNFSDGKTFTVSNDAIPKPTLNVSVNNATVTFSWSKVNNGDTYDIEIYQGSDFNSTTYYKKIGGQTGTSYSIDLPLGTYWAKIAAVNSKTKGWNFSDGKTFTVNAPVSYNVSFSPGSLSLKAGESKNVVVEFTDTSSIQFFRNTSGNSGVATVDREGEINWASSYPGTGRATLKVTGVSSGSTTVTVSLLDSSKNSLVSKSFSVSVTADHPAGSLKMGDVNGDGNIDVDDVLMLTDAVLKKITLTSEQQRVADVNGDNRVTVADSQLIENYVMGKSYTVSFNANANGVANPSSQNAKFGSSFGNLPTLSRSNYTFDGWFTAASGGTKVTSSTTVGWPPIMMLYAHWSENPRTLTSIQVVSSPSKTSYNIGEQLNTSGLSVRANYSNGDSETISESSFSISGFNSSSAGRKTVTVSYGGKTDSFTVTVQEAQNPVNTGTPQIVIENQTVSPGATFTTSVSMKNNPGVSTFTLMIDYDSNYLELVGSEAKDFSPITFGNAYSVKPYSINFLGGTQTATGSLIATLTFKVKDGVNTGSTEITVAYRNGEYPTNAQDKDVIFALVNGKITIQGAKPGDVDENGKVQMRDANRIVQYLADWPVTLVSGQATLLSVDNTTEYDDSDFVKLQAGDDETAQKIAVGSQAVSSGSTFTVPVYMENNPGVNGFVLTIDYNSDYLELTGSEAKDFSPITFGNTYSAKPYSINFLGGTQNVMGSVIANLTFKVKDGVTGSTEITIGYKNDEYPTNIEDEDVIFELVNGVITISQGESPVSQYPVSVTGGTADKTEYAEGASVTITANAPENGKRFKEWTGVDGLTFTSGSATTANATFTMPANAVTVTATYEDIPPVTYAVTVNNGSGSGDYAENASVTITANTPESGKRFKAWTGADGLTFTSGSATTANATFTMPANAVTVTATYEDISATTYAVTVNNGSGSGNYAAGASVTIVANAPENGRQFKEWSDTDGLTFIDGTNKNTATAKFIMPAKVVSVTAVYENSVENVPIICKR